MRTKEEFTSLRKLIHETLRGDTITLEAKRIVFDEVPREMSCSVSLQLTPTGGDAPQEIEGQGVGLVDAVFHATRDALAISYPSLKFIYFDNFIITSDIAKTRKQSQGSDAMGNVELIIRNAERRIFSFTHESRSTTASTVQVVLNAVSHFINAERAVRVMVVAIEEAKSRNRGELAESYTMKLSDLVKHASYAEVVQDAMSKIS